IFSRIGFSKTRAKLFPVLVSFLTILVRTIYRLGTYGKRPGLQWECLERKLTISSARRVANHTVSVRCELGRDRISAAGHELWQLVLRQKESHPAREFRLLFRAQRFLPR